MSTLSGIILIVCILFAIYRIKTYFSRKNNKEIDKGTCNAIIKEINIDEKCYSKPSFDFPNVQPESDMRFVDFGPDLSKIRDEIKVIQYCKY